MNRRLKGFTLVEILLALFIFAIMATIATVALRRIFFDKKVLDQHQTAMNQLQLATAMMRLDISQMIDRPVRSKSGQLNAAVTGTAHTITFTRTGNVNPLGSLNISNLQRVTYECTSTITRGTWDVLDLATATKSVSRVLLKHIKDSQIFYYDDKLKRYTQWPSSVGDTQSSNKNTKNPLPRAVEIVFTDESFGAVDLYIPVFADNLHKKSDQSNDQSNTN
ncbi:MAG: type II secretion system minor pseudopilin GspJ [Gammaproteobacteria bacterium]|nr:type II secretion system minor pseudopilin GspJ [Gammaproteobacteria bacterium]